MRSSRSPHSFGTRTHAVTCALWTSSAAGRSTITSIPPPSRRHHRTVAQGPQGRTNLTAVSQHSPEAPGRPRTPNAKQAHGHQGKEAALRATAGIIAPFMRPRASAKRTDELKAAARALLAPLPLLVQGGSDGDAAWSRRVGFADATGGPD